MPQLLEPGTMNDVAIVKEGWLHKRGQCPRGRVGAGVLELACGLSLGRHGDRLARALGRRAPAASLPAFLEGGEDTGARPRPGSLAARGTARGLLRAGQSCWAWPGACLRPGLGGGGHLHHPGARPVVFVLEQSVA